MGELNPRFKYHCNLTEQPIVLISIQLEIMMLMLDCPSRDPRPDPSRLHLSSWQLAQILKYPPLAETKYNYPVPPQWPIPSPYSLIINSFWERVGVAEDEHC